VKRFSDQITRMFDCFRKSVKRFSDQITRMFDCFRKSVKRFSDRVLRHHRNRPLMHAIALATGRFTADNSASATISSLNKAGKFQRSICHKRAIVAKSAGG